MTDHNESMRERIARAMRDAYPRYRKGPLQAWLPCADAVLTAIEEPTDCMGNGLPESYRPGTYSARDIWRFMVSAAKDGA